MAAISPATVTDVESRSLRTLSAVELAWAEIALEDAFTQIVQQVPLVDDRLSATPVDEKFKRLVVQVQAAMVLRVLKNPDGVLETSIDDYRRRLDSAISSGALYLTDAERQMLSQRADDATSSNAFSIRPWAAATRPAPDPWVPWVP